MKSHLTPEETSQWCAGERDSQVARHLRDCEACAREVEQLGAALGEFRGAVRNWSVPAPPARIAEMPARPTGRWILAAAAAMVLAAAPMAYRHEQQAAAESARADALLLEQIDAQVSQPVPRPMEPLVRLVSWSSASEESSSERNVR
jgi:hypothetical protein